MDSDVKLMAQTCNGNRHALTILVKRYEKPLYNYILRMSGQHANAEDLFQETWLKVYRFRDKYKPDRAFKPWLYQIATNVCRDWGRKKGRAQEVPLEAVEATKPAPNRDNPVQAIQRQELAQALKQAVDALPEKQRAVFWMSRYEELSYEAIAQALEVPIGTVKSRMNHAVQHLRTALESRYHG